MRLIDYIRRNPVVFNPVTGEPDHDTSKSITEDTVTFVVDNVAKQLIADGEDVDGRPDLRDVSFSPIGEALFKLGCDENGQGLFPFRNLVGVLPPYDNCFFEYADLWRGNGAQFQGVHVLTIQDRIDNDACSGDAKFNMLARVYYRATLEGRRPILASDSYAYISCTEDGGPIAFDVFAVDKPPECETPNILEFMITMASMMLLGTKIAKPELSPEIVKTRQVRRWEAAHPDRVTPFVRYYTLNVNPFQKTIRAEDAGGGWEQAWHRVRGHLRHYKSGKVVPVRPYSKGNLLKGLIIKDYAVTAPDELLPTTTASSGPP
jgi:hypothetical protein